MADKLQDGQEDADQRRSVHGRLEQLAEPQPARLQQPGVDAAHEDVDRRVVVDDARRPGGLGLAHDPPERAHQVPQLHLLDRLVGQPALVRRQVAAQPRIALLPIAAPLLEDAGRVAELLVLQQAADKLLPRVFQLPLHLVAPRQHLLRLDLDQQAGHRQEVAHGVDVQLLQHRQILEILVGDRRDGNIGDLHLVLPHQVEQQVQRTAEHVQVNAKVDHRWVSSVTPRRRWSRLPASQRDACFTSGVRHYPVYRRGVRAASGSPMLRQSARPAAIIHFDPPWYASA